MFVLEDELAIEASGGIAPTSGPKVRGKNRSHYWFVLLVVATKYQECILISYLDCSVTLFHVLSMDVGNYAGILS